MCGSVPIRSPPHELGTGEARNRPTALHPPRPPARTVGHESYLIWLNERRYIAVEFPTVQGEVVSFLVRLMVCSQSGDRVLARFDTAHGIAHQDLLTPGGNLREK